jgi:hypothetical protein
MAKVSFLKVESILTDTLRKMMIERLNDLAAIVTLMQDEHTKIPEAIIEQILKRFQNELNKIKKHDPKIFKCLELTEEEELKLLNSSNNLSSEDWDRLKTLKEKIEDLKKELHGLEAPLDEKVDEHIQKERVKHKNKRFNIREGWLPLQ